MKHFKQFAKLILFMIIGGLLAFITVFMSTYLKASAIAGDVSRSLLLMATQEGCVNYNDYNNFIESVNEAYGTEYILIPENTDALNVDFEAKDADIDLDWSRPEHDHIDMTDYSLAYVRGDGRSLLNGDGDDYVNHVQRGDSIEVKAVVYGNIFFNFLMTNDGKRLCFAFPVEAEATGISCKWFKGE